MKKIFLNKLWLAGALLFPVLSANAADTAPAQISFQDFLSYILVTLIVFIIAVIIFAIRIIKLMDRAMKGEDLTVERSFSFNKLLTDAVPIEKEEAITFNHEYDGIRELDNNLPPWWKYMFYATIVFAGIYIFYYHFSDKGELQLAEYNKEMATAEKLMASKMNESTVTLISDKALLEDGKKIFTENCGACHGKEGQGGIGPNLTDEYWLHGGGIRNVFKTIKYGVPAKSMRAWQNDFSPKQMQEVASYILTLQGTTPANAKEPQGEIYSDKIAEK
jgi:cytochrome c oxidase cbb3-type subunit III